MPYAFPALHFHVVISQPNTGQGDRGMPVVDREHRNYEVNGSKNHINYIARDNTDYPFHFNYSATTVSEDGSHHIAQMQNYEVAHITIVSVEQRDGATILNYVMTPDGDEVRNEHSPPQNDALF
jgi:hypothetical protein